MARKVFNFIIYLLLIGVVLTAVRHVYLFVIRGNRLSSSNKYKSQNLGVGFVIGKKIIAKRLCPFEDGAVIALHGIDKGHWLWLSEHKNRREYCMLGKFQVVEFTKNNKIFAANAKSLVSKLSAYAEISGMRTCLGVITDEEIAKFTEISTCSNWVGIDYKK